MLSDASLFCNLLYAGEISPILDLQSSVFMQRCACIDQTDWWGCQLANDK